MARDFCLAKTQKNVRCGQLAGGNDGLNGIVAGEETVGA